MTSRPPRHGLVALLLLVATAVAACDSTPATATPTDAGPAAGELVLGCLSIDAAECRFVADMVLTTLLADRGAPFAIEIQLYGCESGPCPHTLGVREGKVTVEYADAGEPIERTVTGPPAAPRFGVAATAWSGLIEPTSARVDGSGPFPLELGHCGLSWQVDFDGSFWLPVGQVDGDASEVINADRGKMALLAPNLAQYLAGTGFTARLARFPGPKHVWLCA